ncbi:MAG: serine/threonine-protein kinase [Fuerstiella sp.]
MAGPGIQEFLDNLVASRLLTDTQIESLQQQLVDNGIDAPALAQILVRQKRLTDWQAAQLLKGRSGLVLNHYRLLNPIGRGGMGHVFRGLDTTSGSFVAVKVMAKKLTSNARLVARFRREIRASSTLNSEFIVRTLDAGRVGPVDFMVMEYVNGDQVDRIADRLGRIPTGLACEITRQVAEGLQHAHEHQMVHRDIKPANMMIHWDDSGRGITKLMDMGLVLVLSESGGDQSVTRAGQVMGTPDYMSPEQGWDTAKVDIRSDIYSLGCSLFRMLTGRIPFSGTNPLQVLSQRLQRDAPSVLTVCDDIPEAVAEVVSRMTRRDPDARFQTPGDAAAALAAFSAPLTKKAFQAAVAASADHAASGLPNADLTSKGDEEPDESDVTYQQFLSEVENCSDVDLMLTTDTDTDSDSHVGTAPTLDLGIRVEQPGHLRPRARQSGPSGPILLALGGVAAIGVLLATATYLGRPSNDVSSSSVVDSPPPVASDTIASGTIAATEPQTVVTGALWTFTPEIETAHVAGKLLFQVDDSAPNAIAVDPSTGRLSWQIPFEQPVGTYTIPLQLLHVSDGQPVLLSESNLKVIVERGVPLVRLPDLSPFELNADEEFRTSVAAEPDASLPPDMVYRTVGTAPEGFDLNESTGEVFWKPDATALGRHRVSIGVFVSGKAAVLDQQELQLLVLPTSISHVLPDIPARTATAGTELVVDLPLPELLRVPRLPATRVIELAEGAPTTADISADGRQLRWKIPAETEGVVRVPLRARLVRPGRSGFRDLSGTVVVEVDVARPLSATPTDSLPPEEEIAAALRQLRDTYKIRLAAARSGPQKAGLAAQLLEVAIQGDAGATDAALLQLIWDDLALRARALDVLFQVASLRAERYGTDELSEAAAALKVFRRSVMDSQQQDLAVEHGLRLARQAVEQDQFELADGLLDMVVTLLRASGSSGETGSLPADALAASRLAAELSKASGEAIDRIKTQELRRLLNRWQFEPIFRSDTGLGYFGVSQAGTGNVNGRGMWKIGKRFVRLTGTTLQAAAGFLEGSPPRDRFVVRLCVLPKTTSVQLVFGATGGGQTDFNAFAVTLDATGTGRIIDVRNRTTIAEPAAAVRVSADQICHAEVVVDGTTVIVRINGTPVTQAQIPALTPGKIGLACNLGSAEPRVLVRDMRLLQLPDQP